MGKELKLEMKQSESDDMQATAKKVSSASVIIVAKRAEKTIGTTIGSLISQTHPPEEIILVVDSLDDPTVEVATRFPVKVAVSKKGGIGAARREGVSAATKDIIVFTDSDCRADNQWLERIIKVFRNRDDVFVQAGRNVTFGTGREHPTGSEEGKDVWFNFAPTMNFAFRRSVVEKVGNFDPYFTEGGEDMDFSIRLKKNGYRILYNPNALIFHMESGNLTKKAVRDGKTRAKNFRKHKTSTIGAAIVAFFHSFCLLAFIFLLILGFYLIALIVIIPSLLHRTHTAVHNLRIGKGMKYTTRGFVFAYLSNLSFLVHIIALTIGPSPKAAGSLE